MKFREGQTVLCICDIAYGNFFSSRTPRKAYPAHERQGRRTSEVLYGNSYVIAAITDSYRVRLAGMDEHWHTGRFIALDEAHLYFKTPVAHHSIKRAVNARG